MSEIDLTRWYLVNQRNRRNSNRVKFDFEKGIEKSIQKMQNDRQLEEVSDEPLLLAYSIKTVSFTTKFKSKF